MAIRPFGMLLKPLDSDRCLTSLPRTTLSWRLGLLAAFLYTSTLRLMTT